MLHVVDSCTPSTPLTAFVMPEDIFTSTSCITTCTEKDTATCTQIPPTPVADIAEENLVSMDQVLAKYPKLCNKRSVTRLAVKLAKESVFGLQIMEESTPLGTQTLKKLQEDKLLKIKDTTRTFFPPSENPAEFEMTWKACIESISQAYKHER